jgi:hypothetical protein
MTHSLELPPLPVRVIRRPFVLVTEVSAARATPVTRAACPEPPSAGCLPGGPGRYGVEATKEPEAGGWACIVGAGI